MKELRVAFSVVSLRSNQYISLLIRGLEQNGILVEKLGFSRVAARKVDIIHVHWPEHYLRKLTKFSHWRLLVGFLLTLLAAKINRIPVVWTVHNTSPHDSPVSKLVLRGFFRVWLKSVDACIYMAQATADEARYVYPQLDKLDSALIPHGHYKDVIDDISKEKAKSQLGLSDKQFAISHCGIIKEYKNTDALMDTFSELSGDDFRLIVAGACKEKNLLSDLMIKSSKDFRISFENMFLTDEEMLVRVAASDLVVLPYRRVTNSGAALYALSVGRPILAPALGAFIDLSKQFPDWVCTYKGRFSASVLNEAIDKVRSMSSKDVPDLSDFSWENIAAQTGQFYWRLLSAR